MNSLLMLADDTVHTVYKNSNSGSSLLNQTVGNWVSVMFKIGLAIYATIMIYQVFQYFHDCHPFSNKQLTPKQAKTVSSLLVTEICLITLVAITYIFAISTGIPVADIMGFDPVHELNAGIRTLNIYLSSISATNVILLCLLLTINSRR